VRGVKAGSIKESASQHKLGSLGERTGFDELFSPASIHSVAMSGALSTMTVSSLSLDEYVIYTQHVVGMAKA
jgi:hypothetical protein